MNISLEGSIRTCKVDPAWANKLESDRFLNPSNMVCIPWNNHDTAGRPSCADAYNTKTPGCNSSADRVNVENSLRPQYFEYVTLNAQGLDGGSECAPQNVHGDAMCNRNAMQYAHNQTGSFGLQNSFNQNIYPNCSSCASQTGYTEANHRGAQRKKIGKKVYKNKQASWFGFF
jgi:hypothetical protein